MARIPYLDEADIPHLSDLVNRIKKGRRGKLLNPYRALLHAPDLGQAWFDFTNTVRTAGLIDHRLRELIVVLIAKRVRSAYVSGQHIPALALAAGVTQQECDSIIDWRHLASLSIRERAALAGAEEMMSCGKMEDATFREIENHFNRAEQVELTIIVGMYDMARLVFDTLEIDPENSSS